MKHLYKSLITLLLFAANTCAYAGQNIGTKDTIVIVTNNNDDSCMSHLVINKGSVRVGVVIFNYHDCVLCSYILSIVRKRVSCE